MSETVTRGIRISVETEFLDDESNEQQYVFSYHITITNEGNEVVQLMSRHWIITDANNHVEEVKGPGVVGYQPILKPGESFDYTSYCPLKTPIGTMHGTFQMTTDKGELFDAHISPFRLNLPHMVH